MYCHCRCLASLYGWGSWPQLLFWLVNLYFFNLCSLMANNEGQYNPRAQAMEEVHFDWKCIVCSMVALSPLHLEQQHLPGTESVYFDLDNTPWVKCDKCHTPFHLQCGTWESVHVVRSRRFLCTFFCCRQSNLSSPLLISIYSFPCRLKMAWKKKCPDDKKPQKAKGDHGGSSHYNYVACKNCTQKKITSYFSRAPISN